MAFFLKSRSAVYEENRFKMKQLICSKFGTMNEGWVKIWKVFMEKILRDFACC